MEPIGLASWTSKNKTESNSPKHAKKSHTSNSLDLPARTYARIRPRGQDRRSLSRRLQFPLPNEESFEALHLQTRKCVVQVALREVISTLSGSNESLQSHSSPTISLSCSECQFGTQGVQSVQDVRLEFLICSSFKSATKVFLSVVGLTYPSVAGRGALDSARSFVLRSCATRLAM